MGSKVGAPIRTQAEAAAEAAGLDMAIYNHAEAEAGLAMAAWKLAAPIWRRASVEEMAGRW